MFSSVRPKIDIDEDANLYKYSIDFERLEAEVDWSEIGVVCVSRPTNPTGNVLTDSEVEQLDVLAQKHGVPLLIDNAYLLQAINLPSMDQKTGISHPNASIHPCFWVY